MNRIVQGWDAKRALYLVGGLAFVAISIYDRTWWIGLFGIYYAGMAIFRLGCAAGNCSMDIEQKKTEKTK